MGGTLSYSQHDGTWRSLVARLLGVQEAVSSNLAVPIRYHQPDSLSLIGYDLQGAVLSAFFASPHDIPPGWPAPLVDIHCNKIQVG